jgi:hypothetical protein
MDTGLYPSRRPVQRAPKGHALPGKDVPREQKEAGLMDQGQKMRLGNVRSLYRMPSLCPLSFAIPCGTHQMTSPRHTPRQEHFDSALLATVVLPSSWRRI